jgi:hypothetical protein
MAMTEIKNGQINLKLSKRLVGMAEEYSEYHRYTNVQELVRESLRDKVFGEKVCEEYIEKKFEKLLTKG